jgi:adenylate cyclase class 2
MKMKKEIERTILEIDVDKVKKKLDEIGAKKFYERKQLRKIYDFPDKRLDKENAWIRLRTDGEKTTMTLKKHTKGYDEEIRVDVDDFEKTHKLLKKLGLEDLYTQENKRIRYKLGKITFDIDFWPRIPAWLEVEAETEDEVRKGVEMLGFKMKDTIIKNTLDVYKRYGMDLHSIKDLRFEDG